MLEVKNVSKEIFTNNNIKTRLLENVSFHVEKSEITSLIGVPGSGKTTLMKIISTLDEPTSGEIIYPKEGKIVYLPSAPASFPWLSVTENIRFANKKINDAELSKIVNIVGLKSYEKYYPNNNSFGFRLRISLARSLAANPALIILDDVFKLMDERTKEEMYELVCVISENEGKTFLIATSNIYESLLLSDKIYLLRQNTIQKYKSGITSAGKNNDGNNKLALMKEQIGEFIGKLESDEFAKLTF
jgi:ABC-type nitrate/sulfonate/bicarbonate transport system ATPase subunit